VITAQTIAYANERNAIGILGNRLTDSVALIKALGGGWSDEDLPTARDAGSAWRNSGKQISAHDEN
jgi:outer membrane protein TolC